MRINDIIKNAVLMYNHRKSLHLIGPPGCAKTSITKKEIKEAIEEFYGDKLGFVAFHLTSIDNSDVRGFCIPTKNEEDGTPEAMFTRSAIARLIRETGRERGILFFDERLQADTLVNKAIAPTIQDRTLGEDPLPEGWWVISASNRQKDRSGANKPLAFMTNRERVIQVEPVIDELINNVLAPKEYHPLLIAFAKARPDVVGSHEVPVKDEPFCTYRSYETVCQFLTNHPQTTDTHIVDDSVTQELMAGDIGKGAARELFGYMKVANKIPTKEQILADPMAAKLPSTNELDAQYAIMQMCIHHADEKTIDRYFKYIRRLKKELQTSACEQLLSKSKGSTLLNSAELSDFIANNTALVTNTMQS